MMLGYSKLNIFNHLEAVPTVITDPEWETVDNIVKQWLYASLSQQVLTSILKTDATADEVWSSIQALFHENKESKALELDDELRHIVIGDSTIMEYRTRIKSIVDLLANIGASVLERNLVIYAINGLSYKYAHIVTTVHHRKPFLTFLKMRSILTLEERSLQKDLTRLVHVSYSDNASSATVIATKQQNRTPNSRENYLGLHTMVVGVAGPHAAVEEGVAPTVGIRVIKAEEAATTPIIINNVGVERFGRRFLHNNSSVGCYPFHQSNKPPGPLQQTMVRDRPISISHSSGPSPLLPNNNSRCCFLMVGSPIASIGFNIHQTRIPPLFLKYLPR
ncbi:hypothetical protein Lser_V15G05411 [Lactuca serriola]